jgi:hypothetical protein
MLLCPFQHSSYPQRAVARNTVTAEHCNSFSDPNNKR